MLLDAFRSIKRAVAIGKAQAEDVKPFQPEFNGWPYPQKRVCLKPIHPELNIGAYIIKYGSKPEGSAYPTDAYVIMCNAVDMDGNKIGKEPVCGFLNKKELLEFYNMLVENHESAKSFAVYTAYKKSMSIVNDEVNKKAVFDSKVSASIKVLACSITERISSLCDGASFMNKNNR